MTVQATLCPSAVFKGLTLDTEGLSAYTNFHTLIATLPVSKM